TTGGCDLAALGAALSGLVLVGPIELFRPEAASAEFGGYVWLFLLALFWLWVWLAVLVARPRLVVYNISGEELRPVLAEAARQIDPQARWAGDSLALPTLGVSLYMETFEVMRNTSLKSSGGKQNLAGWKALSAELRNQLATLRVGRNPRALGFTLVALGLLAGSILPMLSDPEQVAQAVHEMLSF
ncbi:MAG TPA: hypothetical protein PKC18_16805, partial [Lacipirellulaceae bacterium]|nr:hypothetical protein [Lacipirellulaceae bacterium]